MACVDKSKYLLSLENENEDVARRYREKIRIIQGIDPFTLTTGPMPPCKELYSFPPVDAFDIVNYLVLTHSFYTNQQMEAHKSMSAYKYFEAGFVRNCQTGKTGAHVVIVAQVKHSQRMNNPPLKVICQTDGSVVYAHCTCMAGASEACSYIGVVLYGLEFMHQATQNVSPTDVKANETKVNRLRRTKFKVKYTLEENCQNVKLVFNWYIMSDSAKSQVLKTYKNYPDETTFLMEPYTIGTGSYKIKVEVLRAKEESSKRPILIIDNCYFKVDYEKPIAIIRGGTERYVKTRSDLTIDGSHSRNMDYESSNKNLKYDWVCKIERDVSPNCVGTIQKGVEFFVPGINFDKNMVTIQLTVESTESRLQSSQSQLILVSDEVVDLEIKCIKNCPPMVRIVDPGQLVSFVAECVNFCEKVSDDLFYWSVDKKNPFDYSYAQFGRNGRLFNIKAGGFQRGIQDYLVEVEMNAQLTDIYGSAKLSFPTRSAINIESCSINPKEGTAMTTVFKGECKHKETESYNYEVYSRLPDKTYTLLDADSDLSSVKFTLPLGCEAVYFKVIDAFEYYETCEAEVKIMSLLDPGTDEKKLEEIMENAHRQIENLIKEKQTDEAVQYINGIVAELKAFKKDSKQILELEKEFIRRAMKNLKLVYVNSVEKMVQVADSVSNIMSLSADKPNIDIGEEASAVCRDIAETNLRASENFRFPMTLSRKLSNVTRKLLECGVKHLTPDPDYLIGSISINVTNLSPPLITSAIIEDYPDYFDDAVFERLEKLKRAGENFFKICEFSEKIMAKTMAPGEQSIEHETNGCSGATMKIEGRYLAERSISTKGVTVWPTKDFRKSDKLVEIYSCTLPYDPFSWNKGIINTINVAQIGFAVNKKPIEKFKSPVFVSFTVKPNLTSNVIEGNTPYASKNNESDAHFLFEQNSIAVYRIDSPARVSHIIEFLNLTNEDDFNVVITRFSRPAVKDFQHPIKVSVENAKIFYGNNYNYDSWAYIGILPRKQNVNSTDQKFSLRVDNLICYRWNSTSKKWESACRVSQASIRRDVLYCVCNSLSILAGAIKPAIVRLDEVFLINFTMGYHANFTISIACLVAVFLYSIILIATTRVKPQDIYFLSDAVFTDRYLYLILIKTGLSLSSGTTSNIVLRLTGTKSSTEAHLLNFPDPDRRILQKGCEDWFALAEPRHLGDIIKLELWYDHCGMQPSWYCNSIEIQDYQSEEKWFFQINKWLDVSDKVNVLIEAYPLKPRKKSKGRKCIDLLIQPNTWKIFSCNKSPYLSSFERTNLMVSVVVTIYGICILFYAPITFQVNTGFAYENTYKPDTYLILVGLGSATIAFIFHSTLMFFFRGLLVCNLTIHLILLTFFGGGIPFITSLHWLTAVILGIFIYIAILDNLLFLVAKPVMGRLGQIIIGVVESVEKQRKFLYQKYGPKLLRPYFGHLYNQMDISEIKEKQIKESTKRNLQEHFMDLIMFVTYLTLLYLVTLANSDAFTIFSQKETVDLAFGKFTRTLELEEIDSIESLQDYFIETLIITTQTSMWYENYVVSSPGLEKDLTNKYLGIVRLRQHRTKLESCAVTNKVKFITKMCLSEYTDSKEKRSFSVQWEPLKNHTSRLPDVWKYSSSNPYGPGYISGKFAAYPGGGYIFPLGRTIRNSVVNLDHMKTNNWLDNATRSVVIEYLTYGANANLFNSIAILVEFSTTGYIQPEIEVQTTKMFLNKDEANILIMAIILLFIGITVLLLLRNSSMLLKTGILFFKDWWRCIDIFIIFASFGCLILFLVRTKAVERYVKELEDAKKNEFVEYHYLLHVDYTLKIFAALLIFVATMRLWKLMRFKPVFRVMEKSIILSLPLVVCLLCVYFLFIISESVFGHATLGQHSESFSSFSDSIVSTLLLALGMLGNFEIEALDQVSYRAPYIFYITFLCGNLFFVTIFVAIIMFHHSEAQTIYSNQRSYTVEDFVRDESKYYMNLTKIKLKKDRMAGGEIEDKSLVYPKADEHRYADPVLGTRKGMQGMFHITTAKLRNDTKSSHYSKYDEYLIKKILVGTRVSESEEDEMFFKSYNDEKTQLVADERIIMMQNVVEMLLTPPENVDKRKEKQLNNLQKINNMDTKLKPRLEVLQEIDCKNIENSRLGRRYKKKEQVFEKCTDMS